MSVKRKGLDWSRRLEDEVFVKSNEVFGGICEIELNYFVGSSLCQRSALTSSTASVGLMSSMAWVGHALVDVVGFTVRLARISAVANAFSAHASHIPNAPVTRKVLLLLRVIDHCRQITISDGLRVS